MLDKLFGGVAGGVAGGIIGTVDGFARGAGLCPNNNQSNGRRFENHNKPRPVNHGNGNDGSAVVKPSGNCGGRRQKDRE